MSLLRRIELASQCCRQIDPEQSGAKYLDRPVSLDYLTIAAASLVVCYSSNINYDNSQEQVGLLDPSGRGIRHFKVK